MVFVQFWFFMGTTMVIGFISSDMPKTQEGFTKKMMNLDENMVLLESVPYGVKECGPI